MTDNDLAEIEERFDRLGLEEKLRVLERLIRRLRHGFVDPDEFERTSARWQQTRLGNESWEGQRDCNQLADALGVSCKAFKDCIDVG